ncbi:HEPN/Toprim-associated domain-containing protein [Kitasatospora sp. NPDC054939]
MGDRWHLLLAGQQIRMGKNETPAKLMTVFQEEDKYMDVEWASRVDELYALPADQVSEGSVEFDDTGEEDDWGDEGDQGEEEFAYVWERFGYRTTVEVIVTRLNLMGFSPERCRREMARDIAELREEDLEDGLLVLATSGGLGSAGASHRVSAEQVVDIGLEAYLKRADAPWWASSVRDGQPQLTELEACCLRELEFFFDELDADPRMFLGLVLRNQEPQTVLQLDLSDLLSAGYFKSTEAVSTEALQQLRDETASSGPIIVITEGKFDSRVLARALRIVRPDIAGYFKFWDLGETKAPGGTDRVVANLRSFAAAGVMNRVIGLVDNDAAGLAAEKVAAKPALPRNYSIRRLPDLDYARSYPIAGGDETDDINGRACSIELYFGLDCLRGPDGSPVEVRWKALNGSVGQLQGELTRKAYVQTRIDDLLAAAEVGQVPLDDRWDPMREIAAILVDAAQGV